MDIQGISAYQTVCQNIIIELLISKYSLRISLPTLCFHLKTIAHQQSANFPGARRGSQSLVYFKPFRSSWVLISAVSRAPLSFCFSLDWIFPSAQTPFLRHRVNPRVFLTWSHVLVFLGLQLLFLLTGLWVSRDIYPCLPSWP